MRAQRVREAESRIEMQVAKWTAEGTVKGFENPSTLQRVGIRQLPEICWYLTERMGAYP